MHYCTDGNYNIHKILLVFWWRSMIESLKKGEISKDNFIIIRGQGKPQDVQMLKPTSAIGYFGDKEAPHY